LFDHFLSLLLNKMPTDPPVDFQELAQGATGATNKDYPYAIRATDLMRDFVYATLDVDPSLIEETSGMQGHAQRRLKIPAVPGGGSPVQLTGTNGELSWQAGMPRGNEDGQLLYWDVNANQWVLFTPTPGTLLQRLEDRWEGILGNSGAIIYQLENSWVTLNPPGDQSKLHVLGTIGGQPQWIETEECE
jgi:hypothetical protein